MTAKSNTTNHGIGERIFIGAAASVLGAVIGGILLGPPGAVLGAKIGGCCGGAGGGS